MDEFMELLVDGRVGKVVQKQPFAPSEPSLQPKVPLRRQSRLQLLERVRVDGTTED